MMMTDMQLPSVLKVVPTITTGGTGMIANDFHYIQLNGEDQSPVILHRGTYYLAVTDEEFVTLHPPQIVTLFKYPYTGNWQIVAKPEQTPNGKLVMAQHV